MTERLTEKTDEGIWVKESRGENVMKTLYQCYGAEPLPNHSNCDEGYCAMEKLAEYETAEEDGRLVVLPCEVGQCVYTNHSMSGWYMRKSKRPYLGRVVFIGLNAEDPFFNIILGEGKMLQYKFSDIGKTVFLTKEEAEKALK